MKVCDLTLSVIYPNKPFFAVVVKNPADFVGAYLGQSESQTKGILSTTVGKVLVIDEVNIFYGI